MDVANGDLERRVLGDNRGPFFDVLLLMKALPLF